jgi:pre-mRNA-splicing factor RBM22/SLT11
MMGERGYGSRHDVFTTKWEISDFPILCEGCLGPTPYIRMTKAQWDKECKICTKPLTVFRWKPSSSSRYKQTEICQTCAKVKNVCQTCLFDLKFGLPVEIRDKFLTNKIDIPTEIINRDLWAHLNTKNAIN